MLSHFSCVWFFAMLWTIASQASRPMGFSRQEYWNRLSCSHPGSHSVSSVTQYVPLFVTPWTAAYQASLPITNPQSLLKLMSIKSVMPSNYLILCPHLLLPPSILPSIRVFINESVLCIRWPKYWSFSFIIQ